MRTAMLVLPAALAALIGCSDTSRVLRPEPPVGRSTVPDADDARASHANSAADSMAVPVVGPPIDELTLTFTAADSLEADELALYLSGELRPPAALSSAILRELAAIRSAFAETTSYVGLRFRAQWEAGVVWINFDDSTAARVAADEYHAWDSLNAACGLARAVHVVSKTYRLGFADRLHPVRLAEMYRALPGVVQVRDSDMPGDWSNVFVVETDIGRVYLFAHLWGDCPCGCTAGEYWTCGVVGDRPVFAGYVWGGHEGEPEPWPEPPWPEPPRAWWEVAGLAYHYFYEHKFVGTDPLFVEFPVGIIEHGSAKTSVRRGRTALPAGIAEDG